MTDFFEKNRGTRTKEIGMEDLHDLAVVAERRSEEPIPLNEMKRRLKRDGLLKKGVKYGCEEDFDDCWGFPRGL